MNASIKTLIILSRNIFCDLYIMFELAGSQFKLRNEDITATLRHENLHSVTEFYKERVVVLCFELKNLISTFRRIKIKVKAT